VKIYAGTLFAYNFAEQDDFVVLFATIGRTIAHEMTHAFNKTKNKFNKKDWKNINHSLINQFNQYKIQDRYFVDGKKTLQENFADLGGIEVSLLALKLFMKDNYPQYTETEKSKAIRSFFMTYTQFWREKATSEFEISSLKRLHTPQKFRAWAYL
jgi:predicted metalloendopeptidase